MYYLRCIWTEITFICVYLGFVYHSSRQCLRARISHAAENKGSNIVYSINTHIYIYIYPVLCPKLTLIQPTWSAYPYHLVFLLWYSYFRIFLIWYPYAPTSLYGSTAHCSGYGVAMGCYVLFIVTRTAIVTSQWYDRYCFTEYARTWARHPTTPWQRECTTITDRQSIDFLLDSMRFVTHFWERTPLILRGAIVVLVQYQCYSIIARAFGPRTPYRVGGLAGDVMRAWASHSLVNHWIYTFEASLLSRLLYIVLDKRNTAWLRDTVRQTSAAEADLRSAQRPLTSPGTSAWPYRVTTQYSYHIYIYIHICTVIMNTRQNMFQYYNITQSGDYL